MFICGNSETKALLVVPCEVKSEILKQLHSSRVAGHLGRDKRQE